MKAVILAGGLGTRLSEETNSRPKPMVEIGGMPIIWHIMKSYGHHGINDFVICCGYKGYMIKEFFANYFLHTSDVTIDIGQNSLEIINSKSEPWKVTLVDTGADTMTGGRIKKIQSHVDETFCMTYGDGVSDLDISALVRFHASHGKAATVTACRAPGRFGALALDSDRVRGFKEKPMGDGDWINGGYFVLNSEVFDEIEGPDTVWENQPLKNLASSDRLRAFHHDGYWQPMDTLREKRMLEEHWESGSAPWKVWN